MHWKCIRKFFKIGFLGVLYEMSKSGKLWNHSCVYQMYKLCKVLSMLVL